MTDIPFTDRTYLHDRHRLSHQQIDRWLGENSGNQFLPEKLKQLTTIKTFLFVTDLLKQNEILFTCLKGPLLSYRIYHDPTIRISHDIDLLIDVEMINPVMSILTGNGYQLTKGVFWPQKKAQQEMYINAVHHLSFLNRELGSCVEIHWVLMHNLPVSNKKQRQIIAGNLTRIEFCGRTFTVLTPEFELLYLLIHGARHGWNRLKWLVDIHDYPVDQLDHLQFNKLTRQLKAGRIIGQVNVLLDKFFEMKLPFESENRIPDYFVSYALQFVGSEVAELQSTRELLNHFRYLWHVFPGYYYKSGVIAGILFRHGDLIEIDSSLKIMYYLYRPYSFIKRRILHAQ